MAKFETDNRKVSDKHSFMMLLLGYYATINTIAVSLLFVLNNVDLLILVNTGATALLSVIVGLGLFFQGESEKYERSELDRLAKKYLVKEKPKEAPKGETLGELTERLKGDGPTKTQATPAPTGEVHTNPNLPQSIKFDSNNNLA